MAVFSVFKLQLSAKYNYKTSYGSLFDKRFGEDIRD